jgi:uncharacterized protein YndB with AHSA1/START domain
MTIIDKQTFTMSRVFDAPRQNVFECFTDPKRMQAWWGPAGATVLKSDMDLRVGGTYHYGLKMPDGNTIWGLQVFREIDPPRRLVLINSFSNEKCELSRHPMAPTWPLEMLATYVFDEVEGGKTRFTLSWTPWNTDDAGKTTFAAGHESMTGGWGGTLDKLEAYLTTAS